MALASAVVATLAAGCASTWKAGEAADSPIDIVRSQRAADAPGLRDIVGKTIGVFNTPKVSPTYREYGGRWCAISGKPGVAEQSASALKAHFAALCARRGGTYDGRQCVRGDDPDLVLFFGAAEVRGRCDAVPEIAALVVEPTGEASDPAYVKRLRDLGYLTRAERAARDSQLASQRLREQQRAEVQARDEASRKAAELPRKRQRGTQVCRQEGPNTFVGYVEDSTDEKLRVLVSRAFRTGFPSLSLGGFTQEIVWDWPQRWDLC
jgi:hypothetical protein